MTAPHRCEESISDADITAAAQRLVAQWRAAGWKPGEERRQRRGREVDAK